jgi:hypothetical protein
MERTKTVIDIDGKRSITVKIPVDFIDRMLAEGNRQIELNVDDEKGILVIRPVDKK